MTESKVTQKNKDVQLLEQALKQCLNPSPITKKSSSESKKVKNDPKIKSKSNVRIEGTKENTLTGASTNRKNFDLNKIWNMNLI